MSSTPERTWVSIAASEPSWAFGKNWISIRPPDCLRISPQASSIAIDAGWLAWNCPPTLRLTLAPCARDEGPYEAIRPPIAAAPNCRRLICIPFPLVTLFVVERTKAARPVGLRGFDQFFA